MWQARLLLHDKKDQAQSCQHGDNQQHHDYRYFHGASFPYQMSNFLFEAGPQKSFIARARCQALAQAAASTWMRARLHQGKIPDFLYNHRC
jgi:hypothetical protein